MATNEEVLRAFVVSLGWKSEAAQQKEFVGAIESATLKANLLADGIAEMAKSISGSLNSASENFLQLGIMADQTRTSVQTILALQQAFVQFGGVAGDADAVLRTLNQNTRALNDGNLSYYKQFGIELNKTTGKFTWDLAKGQEALSHLSPAAITQFAELAHISQSTAELVETHGREMEAAKEKAQKTLDAFGVNEEMAASQSKYARALNDTWLGLNSAWNNFTTAIEKPITPEIETFNKWLDDHGKDISGSFRDIGDAFKEDVVDPIASMGTQTDKLQSDSEKIRAFKDSVVDGLGGIKELLDTIKVTFEWVDSFSKWSQGSADRLGRATGAQALVKGVVTGPMKAAGQGDAETHYSGGGAELNKALNPLISVTPPQLPDPRAAFSEPLHDRPPLPPTPKPVDNRSWWQKQKDLWWMGSDANKPPDADKPSPNATPDALETGNGGGFRIPGSDQSIDFADQAVSLKSGGTLVQPGNPLSVRVEKIDPTASGIGGGSGAGGGRRRRSRSRRPNRPPAWARLVAMRDTPAKSTCLVLAGEPDVAVPLVSACTPMKFAMDQLRKEGVPEKNLKNAAAVMVGEAIAESGLRPSTVHDHGTGYGIYGARLGRRDKMLSWLQENGFAKDSLEGQTAATWRHGSYIGC